MKPKKTRTGQKRAQQVQDTIYFVSLLYELARAAHLVRMNPKQVMVMFQDAYEAEQ